MFVLSFIACRFNPDVRGEGADYLQGTWLQDSVAMQDELLNYTLHELTFVRDSIYATLHTTSKVKTIPDSCYGNGQWTEYARGVYIVRGDSLLVEGWYSRADWQLKTAGCHRIGQYLPRFKIARYTADSLVLEHRYDQRTLSLRKQPIQHDTHTGNGI